MSSCTERKPIRQRTESDWTANGIRSDGGRNPIGRRTETDWTANANGRGCSCLSCTNQANRTIHQGGAAVSARLCRLPEQELHQQNKQNYPPGGAAVSAAPTKPTELSFHEPQPDPRPARYHAPRSHEQPIAPIDGHYLLATLHRIHDVRSHMLR